MPTDTSLPDAVTLDRDARRLREAFTRCRRDVSIPQRDPMVRNLVKRVENGRVHLAEHIVALGWDAFQRGAPQPDVEDPGHRYIQIVRAWFDAQARGETVPMPDVIQRAIAAQTAATNAEVAVLVAPCPKTFADARDALRREVFEAERAIDLIEEREGQNQHVA